MRFSAIFLLFVLGCSPVGLIPGGELRGTPAAGSISDWRTVDHCKIVQVETRPDEPYSINIWAAGTGETLYLASGGGTESAWVRHILDEPSVRVRACDTIYTMRAIHTTRAIDLESFLAAVKRKYDWKRHQALEYKDWVFRLDPS